MIKAKKEAALILHNKNWSYYKIARALDLTRDQVIQVIEDYYLPFRDKV